MLKFEESKSTGIDNVPKIVIKNKSKADIGLLVPYRLKDRLIS